jgi:hypothetical protein
MAREKTRTAKSAVRAYPLGDFPQTLIERHEESSWVRLCAMSDDNLNVAKHAVKRG